MPEQIRDAIPPQPELPVNEAGRHEQRHRTVVLSEDRRSNAREPGVSVVHGERHGGRCGVAVRLVEEPEHLGQADQPIAMAPEVRQVVTQGDGVVPHDPQLRVCEPVEREDRHEAAPHGPERGRKAVGAHEAQQEAAIQASGEGHATAAPPVRATQH